MISFCSLIIDHDLFHRQAKKEQARNTGLKSTMIGVRESGSPGLIRTGGRPINSRMLYR